MMKLQDSVTWKTGYVKKEVKYRGGITHTSRSNVPENMKNIDETAYTRRSILVLDLQLVFLWTF